MEVMKFYVLGEKVKLNFLKDVWVNVNYLGFMSFFLFYLLYFILIGLEVMG